MKPSGQQTKRPRLGRRWRVLHRWLGIGAAVFLLLLCVTGVALNHASSLGLGERFSDSRWLLGLYGVSGPEFGPSFLADDRWITLADGRLYLDNREIARSGSQDIVGAAYLGEEIVVAATDELLLVDAQGEVLERSRLDAALPGPIDGIAADSGTLYLRSGDDILVYDPVSARVTAWASGSVPEWIERQPLPASLRESIENAFRGNGISFERVLYDLHSGRLLGLGGLVLMDLTALALCILALSGILLFVRR